MKRRYLKELKELKELLRNENDAVRREELRAEYNARLKKEDEQNDRRLDRIVKIAAIATPLITLAVTTAVGIATTNKVLKFEETGSVNSFAGRSLIGKNLK